MSYIVIIKIIWINKNNVRFKSIFWLKLVIIIKLFK